MKTYDLKLANVPKELLFMMELLKEDSNYPQTNQASDEIDWDVFIELAKHHRLFPILHHKLKSIDSIPERVKVVLASYYKHNTIQMLRLSAEMNDVNRLFNEHEIPLLFLKGPNLAHDLYGDISLRTCGDIDVLIPLNQLDNAEELLIRLGYEKEDYIKTLLGDWAWRHHHVTYFHRNKGMKLEIHWRLNPGPGYEPDFQDLWNRKRKSGLIRDPLFILGKEDLFFFLVTHGARHGWSRLRWLVDIQQFLKKEHDWRVIVKLFNRYHHEKVAGQALYLANQLLNASMPKYPERLTGTTSHKLAQDAIFYMENMVNLHSNPVPEYISHYHARHLFSLMSVQQKCLFLMSWLFPFPEDAEILPLPKRLHFLYFPLRPMLWAWRKTRKQAIN